MLLIDPGDLTNSRAVVDDRRSPVHRSSAVPVRIDYEEERVAEHGLDWGEGLLACTWHARNDLRPLRPRLLGSQVEVVVERPHPVRVTPGPGSGVVCWS